MTASRFEQHLEALRKCPGVEVQVVEELRRTVEELRQQNERLTARLAREAEHGEEENAHLAAIVASSGEAIISVKPEGTIASWNPGAEKLFGYAVREMIGQSLYLLTPTERHHEIKTNLEAVRHGNCVHSFDTACLPKEGGRVEVSMSLSPIRNWTGQLTGVSAIILDTRKQKEAQRRAVQAEWLTGIGQVVGDLSHESRNAFQRIKCCLAMLALEVQDRPAALDLVARVKKAQDQLYHLYEEVCKYSFGK
jgi:PAS domain S-box-containing protein